MFTQQLSAWCGGKGGEQLIWQQQYVSLIGCYVQWCGTESELTLSERAEAAALNSTIALSCDCVPLVFSRHCAKVCTRCPGVA